MTIRVLPTKDVMCNDYTAYGPYLAAFTADPGTAGNATNEVTGGSPAYARVALGWTTSTGGAGTSNGSGTLNIPAGTTVNYVGVCGSNVAGTNDVRDNVAVTPQTFATQGTYAVNTQNTQG